MPYLYSLSLLHPLHQRRRLLVVTLLSILMMSIVTVFVHCLPLAAFVEPSKTVVVSAEESGSNMMAGGISCPPSVCAVTTDDRMLSGEAVIPSAGFKPWSVVLFVAATLLLTSGLPRRLPLPPQPLLPKRPRTLKFYALRI